jgi:hypothetical protein
MVAPQWLRSTGAAAAIALSSLPMLAALPGVVAAHDHLNRELQYQAVSSSADYTALAVIVDTHRQPSANE